MTATNDRTIKVSLTDSSSIGIDRSHGHLAGHGMTCIPSTLVIAQLLNLFVMHDGFVPPRELTAEGFDIQQLEADGLIYRSRNRLDGDCFLIGDTLREAIRPTRPCPFSVPGEAAPTSDGKAMPGAAPGAESQRDLPS